MKLFSLVTYLCRISLTYLFVVFETSIVFYKGWKIIQKKIKMIEFWSAREKFNLVIYDLDEINFDSKILRPSKYSQYIMPFEDVNASNTLYFLQYQTEECHVFRLLVHASTNLDIQPGSDSTFGVFWNTKIVMPDEHAHMKKVVMNIMEVFYSITMINVY